MKKTALFLSLLLLQGCMLVDAYLMTHYDDSEYALISKIRADAASYKSQCNDFSQSKINAVEIARQTQFYEFFEERVPRNKEGHGSAKNLNAMAQDLKQRYSKETKVSKIYCELKFGSIENASNLIQKVIAGRPR